MFRNLSQTQMFFLIMSTLVTVIALVCIFGLKAAIVLWASVVLGALIIAIWNLAGLIVNVS